MDVARTSSGRSRAGSPAPDTTDWRSAGWPSAGIDSPLVQRYLVWRRSVLLVALPSRSSPPCSPCASWWSGTSTATRRRRGRRRRRRPRRAGADRHRPARGVTWRGPGCPVACCSSVGRCRCSRRSSSPCSRSTGSSAARSATSPAWTAATIGASSSRIAVSIQYAIVLLPSLLSFPSGLVRGRRV